MTPTPIRVLVVDDHVIVREGIRALLAESEDIKVVGEASNGQEAIRQAERAKPDVILMDLIMPEMDGIEALGHISSRQPDVRFLVLTTYSGDDLVFPAIKAGAHGYLLKDSGAGQLVQSIRQVHQGEPSLHPDIARKLMQEIKQLFPDKKAPNPLTAREVEVLSLLARGLDNQEIAERLSVAEVTVRSHISRILDKLHLANRVQATLYALREGLTTLDHEPQ
jgi:NarL family two-component system response regulator LiaR